MWSWIARSAPRDRLLRGVGFVLIGIVLARGAIVGPASACERAPLHRGGDMVPGFCVDYGAAWSGWPLLVVALASVALGFAQLQRACDATRFPTTLRSSIVLVAAGSALLYLAWSQGSMVVCTTTLHDFDADVGDRESCATAHRSWHALALVGGGAVVGAGATLAAAVAVRAAQDSGSDARVAPR